jgi:hypothetical protein
MGLKTYPNKTKAMICTPQPSITRIGTPAYKRWMGNHDDPTYKEWKRQQVECDICHKHVQARSLTRHKCTIHGIDTPNLPQQTPPHLVPIGNTYEISMPDFHPTEQCPVPGCGATIQSRYGMRCHFAHRHYCDTIIITEEGPLPWCELCGMFCTLLSLSGMHQESAICQKGAHQHKQKQKNLQCIQASWRTFLSRSTNWNCNGFPIPRSSDYIKRQWLDGSPLELTKSKTTMDEHLASTGTWIRIPENICTILQSYNSNSTPIWLRDMGHHRRDTTTTNILSP